MTSELFLFVRSNAKSLISQMNVGKYLDKLFVFELNPDNWFESVEMNDKASKALSSIEFITL